MAKDKGVCRRWGGASLDPRTFFEIVKLKGKLDGFSMRVPTPNVSVVDLVALLGKKTMKLEFERDASRAEGNLAKHGVASEEAVSVFAGPVAAFLNDPAPPGEESREILVGLSMP